MSSNWACPAEKSSRSPDDGLPDRLRAVTGMAQPLAQPRTLGRVIPISAGVLRVGDAVGVDETTSPGSR